MPIHTKWMIFQPLVQRQFHHLVRPVLLLFLVPAKPSWNPDLKKNALLDWHTIQTKLEWGVIFIRGGGFAMADAVKVSKVNQRK